MLFTYVCINRYLHSWGVVEAWLLEPTGGQRRSAVFPLLPEGTVQLLPHRSSGIYFSPVFKKRKRKRSFKKREKRNKGVSEKDSPAEHVKPCCQAGILSMFILRCPFSLSTIRQLFHSFLFQVEFMRCENIPLWANLISVWYQGHKLTASTEVCYVHFC